MKVKLTKENLKQIITEGILSEMLQNTDYRLWKPYEPVVERGVLAPEYQPDAASQFNWQNNRKETEKPVTKDATMQNAVKETENAIPSNLALGKPAPFYAIKTAVGKFQTWFNDNMARESGTKNLVVDGKWGNFTQNAWNVWLTSTYPNIS